MHSRIIQDLLTTLNQIKVYHWQTRSFSTHKALDKAYNSLSNNVDRFIEILIGKYGRDIISTMNFTIFSEQEVHICDALNEITNYLINISNDLDKIADVDLINIRDEMLGTVNYTKYLLTLD